MNEELIGEAKMNIENDTNWKKLYTMSDEEIHTAALIDPDAQPTDEAFWKNAKVVFPEAQETVTIKLDSEMLKWFKEGSENYQARINAVLCAYYMQANSKRKHQSN
jgi:uncharacterized protein (DUF4415 family)